jgi:hypothetical protein
MKTFSTQIVSSASYAVTAPLFEGFHFTQPDLSFGTPYHHCLQDMLDEHVRPLLLNLPRPAKSVFITSVLSDDQYQYQISNTQTSGSTFTPEQAQFTYIAPRHHTTASFSRQ